MKSYNKDKAARNNNFQHCAISPNGYYIAYMARTSLKIELGLIQIEHHGMLTYLSYIYCDSICPSCISNRNYNDRYQCKFSPDSLYIAAATSFGHLLIVNKPDLTCHCKISPGIVEWGVDNMTNERSYDFDPRFNHERLAFGSIKQNVHFCNIDNKTIEETVHLDDGHIQCVKFHPRGHCLAVACSSGIVHILNSDNGDVVMRLDGSALPSEAAIGTVNGSLAEAVSMSFTSMSEVLAVSHTDGYVRLWQLSPELNLQTLCKRTILQHVKLSQLHELPIPQRILEEMTSVYTM